MKHLWILLSSLLYSLETYTQCTLVEMKFEPHKDEFGTLSSSFLQTMKAIFDPEYFIETGTMEGNSSLRAASIFKQVHTIELSPHFYALAKKKFAEHNNIHAHLGSSDQVLPTILLTCADKRCLFFLDAHFSGGVTARGSENTPLLKEIAVIQNYLQDAVVIIDDIRLCQPPELGLQHVAKQPADANILGYPLLTDIRRAFQNIDPHYVCVVWGDVLIAYRTDLYPFLRISPILSALTISRWYQESADIDLKSLLAAEQIIKTAAGTEAAGIIALQINGLSSPPILTTHYTLWNALLAAGRKNYTDAMHLLKQAWDHGLHHWRIKMYQSEVYASLGDTEQAMIAHDTAQKMHRKAGDDV